MESDALFTVAFAVVENIQSKTVQISSTQFHSNSCSLLFSTAFLCITTAKNNVGPDLLQANTHQQESLTKTSSVREIKQNGINVLIPFELRWILTGKSQSSACQSVDSYVKIKRGFWIE